MIFVFGLVLLIRWNVLWYPRCVTGGRRTKKMHAYAALHLVRSNIIICPDKSYVAFILHCLSPYCAKNVITWCIWLHMQPQFESAYTNTIYRRMENVNTHTHTHTQMQQLVASEHVTIKQFLFELLWKEYDLNVDLVLIVKCNFVHGCVGINTVWQQCWCRKFWVSWNTLMELI